MYDLWLPSELWWECLRWATLPTSGHLPLLDPPTCLDTWTSSVPGIVQLYEGPDFCYFYEQLALRLTKRRLPLVCKLWASLSTQFLYECITINQSSERSTCFSQLLNTLQQPNRGAGLAKFVKRIDIESDFSHSADVRNMIITFISILPELRVLRSWRNHLVQPLAVTLKDQPALSKLNDLLAFPNEIASINPTQVHWKALTVVIDTDHSEEELPTLNQPMLYLKYLTLIFDEVDESTIISSLSRLQGWSLPSLTHLSFYLYLTEQRAVVRDVVDVFGKQLEFLAVASDTTDTNKSWFCEILTAVPNIKEFVFSPQPSDNISFGQLPPAKYTSIEVVGLPVDANYFEDFSWYTRLCVQAFPSLRTFRITGDITLPNQESGRHYNEFWVRGAAINLRSEGIRFEDRTGRDLWEVLGTAADEKEDASTKEN
jgi:hypothetical protein